MARIIGWLCGGLIAGACGAPLSNGQEFLKQLENRLKEAAGNQADSAPPEPRSEEPLAAESEQLPVPSSPQAIPRSGQIVITPKKQRKPAPPSVPIVPEALDSDEEGYLGLTLEPLPGGNFGLAVVEVAPQSPAWKSGFRVGDRVIGLGGQAVTTIDQFASALQSYAPGEPIKFLVQRQGRSVNLTSILQGRALAGQLQGNLSENLSDGRLPRPLVPYQPISGSATGDQGMVLGVSVSDLSTAFRQQFNIPVYRGASVSEVVVGSAAERAGIRPGDCIVEIDGRMIFFADEVVRATRSAIPGQTMLIGFYRGVQKMQVAVAPQSDAVPEDPGVLSEGDRDRLSPRYVSELQAEIVRLQQELEAMRLRVQDLESRLPPNR